MDSLLCHECFSLIKQLQIITSLFLSALVYIISSIITASHYIYSYSLFYRLSSQVLWIIFTIVRASHYTYDYSLFYRLSSQLLWIIFTIVRASHYTYDYSLFYRLSSQVLWIIFTIINASLGFLISAVLVLNKRVFYAVQKKCLCYSTDSIAVVSTQVPRHWGKGDNR